jgi:hypothetical protein
MNTHSQTLRIDRGVWRIGAVDRLSSVLPVTPAARIRNLHLEFSVSSDEEHVSLRAFGPEGTFDLGARTHNYFLLTLARCRLRDAAAGLPEGACGWTGPDDLPHEPMMFGPRLNVAVFRIRRQFADCAVADPEAIVERRPRARQMRLGTSLITILRV